MRSILFIFIALLLIIDISKAQEIKNHPFSDRWVLSLNGGLAVGKTDYMSTINSYNANGMVEYFFATRDQNIFSLRLVAGLANIKGKDERRVPNSPAEFSTDIRSIGLGINYMYSIQDIVFPYVYGGASIVWFNPLSSTGEKAPNNQKNLYSKNALCYDVEGGFRFKINNDWSIFTSGAIHFVQSDYLDDVSPASQINPGDFPAGPHDDFYATVLLGVSFSLHGQKDSDGDGVPDSRDFCPNTPQGVLIDENGCPLDIDGDGVPDYLDKCPQTPQGVKVDKNGCPLDSDGDGVPDYLDKCPNTSKGITVNATGCPPDSDNDGVPDYLDKCPYTPDGVKVDKDGCPLDSDGDGVPDYLDRCPGTPAGEKVDQFGCATKESPQPRELSRQNEKPRETAPNTRNENILIPAPLAPKQGNATSLSPNASKIIISVDETFEPGTEQIKPSAYANLDNIVNFLKKDPWTKWKIQGYVDNQTPEARKLSISYEEANAIMKYFISKGLPSFQFQVLGLGDESPVASNATPEGRSKNRRVEIIKNKK